MRTFEPLKFLGRFFFIPLRMGPNAPLVSVTPSWEMEPPHRFSPTLVVRLPRLLWGVGFGWWRDTEVVNVDEEKQARQEIEAANAAYDAYVKVNGNVPRDVWDEARQQIANLELTPDEEMECMQNLGIFE